MQLSPPSRPDPHARDLAAALQDAHRQVGSGPAVSVLFPEGRQEQGMTSLAQWAAKGAHLLELDLLLQPGDRLHLDAPLSWTSAAVCLAAWWAGVTVTLDGDAEVAVVYGDRPTPAQAEVFRVGDAIDGSPGPGVDGPEPWVRAVQTFPDQPPPPRAASDRVAVRAGGRDYTHTEVVDLARSMGEGTAGVDAAGAPPFEGLVATAARPLVHHRPTVVLRGVEAEAAEADRVRHWITGR